MPRSLREDQELADETTNTCVALVLATRKLRHYMLAYKVLLIAIMDPLKYLMEKPVQEGKTTNWVLLLSEFDIK